MHEQAVGASFLPKPIVSLDGCERAMARVESYSSGVCGFRGNNGNGCLVAAFRVFARAFPLKQIGHVSWEVKSCTRGGHVRPEPGALRLRWERAEAVGSLFQLPIALLSRF